MTWRAAFIAQAKHDYAMFKKLNDQRENFADQLHYLQMATEKLSRGFLAAARDMAPPPLTHVGFVRMLQHLKTDPFIRRRLGYTNKQVFRSYIDSVLDIAGQIQSLAPSIAGVGQPNPEYPWQGKGDNNVIAPFQFDFSELDELKNVRAAKLLKLFGQLVDVIDA